jgi:hypothetical protein
MRNGSICLIVILAFGLTAAGQAPTKKWKVVQVVQLTEQTATIPATTIFTPTTVQLYRLSVYLDCGGHGVDSGEYWEFQVGWTSNGGGLSGSCGAGGASGQTVPFIGKVGTPVFYEIEAGPRTATFPYTLELAIEQLE